MRDALDDLTEAYEQLLPRIISQHGHGWVVFAGADSINRFAAFPQAARFARKRYGKRQVLIRHTDERPIEVAPFIEVHSER